MTRTAIGTDDGQGEMLTVDEASRRMYISSSTIRHYIDNGELRRCPDGRVALEELMKIRAESP